MLPWFLLYGLGAGLLLPLTDVILGALAAERAGVASGTLNVSREVFGLLGITVLGAILNYRQSGHLHDGYAPSAVAKAGETPIRAARTPLRATWWGFGSWVAC